MEKEESYFTLDGKDGSCLLFESRLKDLNALIRFMRDVVNTDTRFFTGKKTQSGHPEVSHIGRSCGRLADFARAQDPTLTYSPLAAFFFEEYAKHAIAYYPGPLSPGNHSELMIIGKLFDDFLSVLRKRAKEVGLKAKTRNWDNKPKRNRDELLRMTDEVFERRAKVLVIRLDFNYHAAKLDEADLEKMLQALSLGGSKPKGRVPFSEVQRDRALFISRMKGKRSLFKDLLAYAWRIECTPVAGFHLHFIFFFDGSKVMKHEWMAQKIGEYWSHDITNGRGYYENVNRRRKNLPRHLYGVGMIDYHDAHKRGCLVENVLSYFWKTNQSAQLIPYPKANLFGTGSIFRGKPARQGRPRSKGSEVMGSPDADMSDSSEEDGSFLPGDVPRTEPGILRGGQQGASRS
ncbi:inovirus-type Gp2 protein [Rhodoferax sp. BAB1]|uniref:YagK/YfjJ domain-containing protein n=1 Tax=Rhodoferax sp. BAB1 TaxID=2741720 RepID=UPI00157728D4|nr:inovirus-type Gp2 protein [Rhodoferax sp. BAB1]QKO20778.1 inovirus-type Gp2 protein [Rhodoferax sp. BAB1]